MQLNSAVINSLMYLLSLVITASNASAQIPMGVQWQTCIGGSAGDAGHVIRQTPDGGYMIGAIMGFSGENAITDYNVLKIDNSGQVVWQVAYGGSWPDELISMELSSDGGVIAVGYTYSSDGDVTGFHGTNDIWLIKLNAQGDLLWQKCLGGSGAESAFDVCETPDGGMAIAGYAHSTDGDVSTNQGFSDVWILRLDQVGEIMWERSYGGSSSDGATSIQFTADGGFIVAAETMSSDGDVVGHHGQQDIWILKLDALGDVEWKKCYGGTVADIRPQIIVTSDGGYLFGCESSSNDGDISGNHGFWDLWFVKLDTVGEIVWQYSAGGSQVEAIGAFIEDDEGGYIACGRTFSNDGDVSGWTGIIGPDAWLFKLDQSGGVLWQKCLGGTGSDVGSSVRSTNEGGLILLGSSTSNDGDVTGNNGGSDVWVVKFGDPASGVLNIEGSTFQMFPNPTSGIFQIEMPPVVHPGSLLLHDVLGRGVLRDQVKGTRHQLDLSDQAKGIYLVTLQTDQGISTQRLVLE